MKTYSYVLLLLVICTGLIACTDIGQKKQASKNDTTIELTSHMLAKHTDIELDEYYTELYEGIKHRIKQNPEMGMPNDFSVQSYRTFENYQGPFYVFLGINRLDIPIKNISFNLTIGNDEGDLLWEDETIFLSEEETGIIPANSVIPILIPITKEDLEKTKQHQYDDYKMEMTGFYYEKVDL